MQAHSSQPVMLYEHPLRCAAGTQDFRMPMILLNPRPTA